MKKNKEYINQWVYLDNIIDENELKKYIGFVYLLIDTENDKKYIGKKFIWNYRKSKKTTKKERKESNWKFYYSSNLIIKNIAKNTPLRFKRIILHLCDSIGKTNWYEIEEQFKRDVLKKEEYYNDNINGKWFKKNVIRY